MAKKKGNKLYTDTMIGSLYGLTKGIIREAFPTQDRIVIDSQGFGHPAWYQSTLDETLKDSLIQEYISEKPFRKKYGEIIEYLKRFDYSEMITYARMMDRNFILHIGPMNGGKTYQAYRYDRCSVPELPD